MKQNKDVWYCCKLLLLLGIFSFMFLFIFINFVEWVIGDNLDENEENTIEKKYVCHYEVVYDCDTSNTKICLYKEKIRICEKDI